MDKKRVLLLRHLLMLSLALNVGLVLRLGYVGESWRAEEQQGVHSLCLELEQQQTRGAAHVSRKTTDLASWTSTAAHNQVENGEAGSSKVINLDHGDPTMYERFWRQAGDKTAVMIAGWQYTSYFSDPSNLCWFLEPEFAKAIVRLHKLVGNAVTKERHIVVGTGSSQLFQAALYALCPADAPEPMSIVSAAPYYSTPDRMNRFSIVSSGRTWASQSFTYSNDRKEAYQVAVEILLIRRHLQPAIFTDMQSYPLMTDFLKSGLYKWAGDAHEFRKADRPYIELVTSPNNPDGSTREAVVNRSTGILIHDLAYYWPQYTPISSPADHDLMLFTVSKSTGHAGTRIGWALVKDEEVARKMTKFIEVNTIGVSKDSQLRAAKILHAVAEGYNHVGNPRPTGLPFFDYSHALMEKRWKQLRAAVKRGALFSLPDFPTGFCTFTGRSFESQPAFAWLKCQGEIEDCERFLRGHRILTRGGKHFGVSSKYVRISMLERDEVFELFTGRLSAIQSS